MKRVIGFLIVLLSFLSLTGCQVDSLSKVKANLKNSLSVSISYISEKGNGNDGISYYFVDENGINFSFTSGKEGFALDGQTFFDYKSNSCDYPESFLEFHSMEMGELYKQSGLEIDTDPVISDYYLEIIVNSYDQVEKAADLVNDLLANFQIPIKRESAIFRIPEIRISNGDSFNSTFEFSCDYNTIPDKNEIYQTLLSSYVTDSKNGTMASDLPMDISKNVKPIFISTVHFNVGDAIWETKDYTFEFDDELQSYVLYLYDLKETNIMRFYNGELKGFLKILEYSYSYENDYLLYKTNGNKYTFKLNDDNTELMFYKNDNMLDGFKVKTYDEYSGEVILVLTAEELGELLNLTVSVDTQNAIITFGNE